MCEGAISFKYGLLLEAMTDLLCVLIDKSAARCPGKNGSWTWWRSYNNLADIEPIGQDTGLSLVYSIICLFCYSIIC